MTKLSQPKRIGIFGHVGTQNLGDETIIAAVIQNIRLRYPDAEIRAFTFNPEDTSRRHGIAAFPIRQLQSVPRIAGKSGQNGSNSGAASKKLSFAARFKESLKKIPLLYHVLRAIQRVIQVIRGPFKELAFLAQCYKNLKGMDLLIVAGSGQLTDHSGGPWAYPYTIFKWSVLARARGAKLAFVSIGTSWINSSVSEFFLKSALSHADYRSCRDESSGHQVEELGVTGENLVVPDLAYSLRMPGIAAQSGTSRATPIVGINPIPFFHEHFWHKADKKLYDEYVSIQANFASWLIHRGYAVLFFPTQLRADPPAIHDIVETLERENPGIPRQLLVDPPIFSSEDLISAMSRMDIIVAARYHGVLISHLLHKPVLAVSYHQKTTDLMARMGQSECTIEIDVCTLDAMKDRFLFLESQTKVIEAELERRVPLCRTVLDAQYERVFGLLEHTTA
jgi:polysaccharide pyruvyl transferase WcaK-like protein